ncbi:MAG: hypothetical protein LBO73_00945 [Holosporaceae bacterium]|nr:hypothetical protein [Holosporaceae bacterium]
MCGGVKAMEQDTIVSGMIFHDSDIGYYLLHYGAEDLEYVKKLSLEEVISKWERDLPTTKESFNEFMNGCSAPEREKVFFRLSTEIIFCCMERRGLDEEFKKLRSFVSLLSDFKLTDLKKSVVNSLFSCLESDFFNS